MYNYSYDATTVCQAVNGRIHKKSARPIQDTVIHTASVQENTLFIPLHGTRTDGHQFIEDAIRKGASAVFFEKDKLDPSPLPDGDYTAIEVDDTLLALGSFAAFHRTQCHCFVIGVTGSVGKTTTKQFLHAIFSSCAKTVATHENYNNEIGVPLTLLSISPHDAYAIVEMGMSAFGEISYLSKMVQPDLAIITNIGTSHLGKLGSRKNIARAKSEILDGLRSGGKLIVDGDEPLLSHLPNKITVSRKDPTCDYTLCDYLAIKDTSTFRIQHRKQSTLCALFAAGEHCAYDATLAFAVAKEVGICESIIVEGLRHYHPSAMRQVLHQVNGRTIIEDCYNASYESMIAALRFTRDYATQTDRKAVAILGDMLELGNDSPSTHRAIGMFASQIGIQALYACGEYATETIRGFSKTTDAQSAVFECDDIDSLLTLLPKEDAVILLKGSHALHLERLLPSLLDTSN